MLHRIGDQVQQHLLQAAPIALEPHRLSGQDQLERLTVGHWPGQIDGAIEEVLATATRRIEVSA